MYSAGGSSGSSNQPYSPFQPSPWASTPTHAAQPGWNDYSNDNQAREQASNYQQGPYGQDQQQPATGTYPAGDPYDPYGQDAAKGQSSPVRGGPSAQSNDTVPQPYGQNSRQHNPYEQPQTQQRYAQPPPAHNQRPLAAQRQSSNLIQQQQQAARGGEL